MRSSAQFYFLGFIFVTVWASASVAAKLGFHSVQPLVLYQARFGLAAICLLLLAYLRRSPEWPRGKEWGQLALFGFLNVTVALGLFAFAIKEVTAGIGALQVGVNPLVIGVLSALVAKRRICKNEVLALLLGVLGVGIAVYPLLQNAYGTAFGLVLLWLSSLAYSSASVYFGTVDWKLKKLTINAWQGLFGALFLFPATFFFYDAAANVYDSIFFYAAFWLGLALSAGAVYLWLWLLTADTLRASFFLFLCPAFGFIYAYFILNEPFTWHTLAGLSVVMTALYIGQKKKANPV